MFPDWNSLDATFQDDRSFASNLQALPREVAIDICKNVCKSVVPKPQTAFTIFSGLPGQGTLSSGSTLPATTTGIMDSEDLVCYSMEVLSFALSLDFEHHEVIRDATFAYCDWLSSLSHVPKYSVPDCVRANPNLYCRRIIKHLYNLFVPRERQSHDVIQKQGVLCHRALRTLQDIFKTSTVLEVETWNVLLQTLLTMCEVMLGHPVDADDFSDYFSKRLLGVLFDLWLTACQRSFPSAAYWKTFSLMSIKWRHRLPVVEEWLRVVILLFEKTNHLVAEKSGSNSIAFRNTEQMKVFEDWRPANPVVLTEDLLVQTQMRILLLSIADLGEVANSEVGSSVTDKNLRSMFPNGSLKEAENRSTQPLTPLIFLKMMTGVTIMVDLAMNKLACIDCYLDITWPDLLHQPPSQATSTSQSEVTGLPVQPAGGATETFVVPVKNRLLRCEERIPCRGLLHLFGPWLFQASLAGRADGKLEEAIDLEKELLPILLKDSDLRQPGRAEAIGTLCRIFSFFSDGPDLKSDLSARFALILSYALSLESSVGYALSNALRNSHDIFRADVRGLESVLLVMMPALEVVLLQKLPQVNFYPEIGADDLRSAALHLLSSVICLPKYFDLVPLNDIRSIFGRNAKKPKEESETFGSLYYRMLDLVLSSIISETNSANCIQLLGCLYTLFVHPCVESSLEESTDVRFTNGSKIFIAMTHLLNSVLWPQDSILSYACLEFLHTCARYSTKLLDQTTTKLVIMAICRYIQDQAQKPSRAHSKDLHNKIIVAYHCLTAWMLEWPSMLQESEVLTMIADVSETGLTGVRTTKTLKTMQPASALSARVREMAELVQLTLFEFVGCSNDPGAFQYLDNLVDEECILKYADAATDNRQFHYFTIDGSSALLGVLCSSGANGETFIVERSLSCRRAYHMKFVRTVASKVLFAASPVSVNGEHPHPVNLIKTEQEQSAKRNRIAEEVDWDFVAFRNEIPGYKNIEKCKADNMLPTFDDVMKKNEKKEKEINDFLEAFDRIETEIAFTLPDAKSFQPYVPPFVVASSALPTTDGEDIVVSQVLAHLGLKPPTPLSSVTSSQLAPSTVQLDHKNAGLRLALSDLDRISIRPLDWVFSFYVGRDDHSIEEILRNGDNLTTCSQDYIRFLKSLAWPIKVADVMNRQPCSAYEGKVDISCLDGEDLCLLRSSVSHELGIIAPSSASMKKRDSAPSLSSTGSYLEDVDFPFVKSHIPKPNKLRSYSVDDVDSVADAKSVPLRPRKHAPPPEPRFLCLFVWMDSFRDEFVFPAAEALRKLDMERLYWKWHNEEDHLDASNASFEYRIIYIYPAAHGLYEIRLRNMDGNPLLAAIPLVNGVILSHALLGTLITDCVVNLFTRKRLALESYAPGQIRRRNQIQDISNRFAVRSVTDSTWGS